MSPSPSSVPPAATSASATSSDPTFSLAEQPTAAAASPDSPALETQALETQARKADHLRICLDEDVQSHRITNGLERYRFTHCCLPELNRDEIDISTTFLGKSIATPLLISSMTGGTAQAQMINQRLAKTAQRFGLAMGVGSQRVAVENADLTPTFAVRQFGGGAAELRLRCEPVPKGSRCLGG